MEIHLPEGHEYEKSLEETVLYVKIIIYAKYKLVKFRFNASSQDTIANLA